jgi:DNA-binding MarR family transcriptional regulator
MNIIGKMGLSNIDFLFIAFQNSSYPITNSPVMKIEQEIQQKVFPSNYYKAHINILFTSSWLSLQVVRWLKPFSISMQQFNILRILKGSWPDPLTVSQLMDRMLDKSSNASRLVDKLSTKRLVAKMIPEEDQRMIMVFITNEGLEVLKMASLEVDKGINSIYTSLSFDEAGELSDLLDKLRG